MFWRKQHEVALDVEEEEHLLQFPQLDTDSSIARNQ
jgi:hypothetical protein